MAKHGTAANAANTTLCLAMLEQEGSVSALHPVEMLAESALAGGDARTDAVKGWRTHGMPLNSIQENVELSAKRKSGRFMGPPCPPPRGA